ncbi:MAG: hypothetical protein ACM31C_30350 [Acidobacteriota bacterium]
MRRLIVLAVASCSVGGPAPTTTTEQPVGCPQLEGKTFQSVNQLECGLGPTGVQSCPWHLYFDANANYEWQHSDVGGSGMVACSGDAITVMPDFGTLAASYDAATGQLTWDGQIYLAMP